MDTLDLYWLPVGAGTHFQRASLAVYESFAAALARRPRSILCHAALKGNVGERPFTIELTPVPAVQDVRPAMAGAVGSSLAARLRIFRYQLVCRESDALPDEQWRIGHPQRLSSDATAIQHLLALARTVPAHTWGRRVRGTSEMWTSNSAVSWLLLKAAIPLEGVAIPDGATAPGWQAGIDAWKAENGSGVESRPMEITRAITPADLGPLLAHPPRATLAFVRDGAVEAIPVAFFYDAGRYLVGLSSKEPPPGRVRLLIDDGPWYFDLRGLWARGRLTPTSAPAGSVAAAAWFELEPEKTVAWHYGRMRDA